MRRFAIIFLLAMGVVAGTFAPAQAQTEPFAPFEVPEEEIVPSEEAGGVLNVSLMFDATGQDSIEIRGAFNSSEDLMFSLGRNVADALDLPRDSYDIVDPFSEDSLTALLNDRSDITDRPDILLSADEHLATREGDQWKFEINTAALQRVALQNGFSELSVDLCPVTDGFETTEGSPPSAGADDECPYWQLASDAEPLTIGITEEPQSDDFWGVVTGQAIAGVILVILGFVLLALARRKGRLSTLNGGTIGWIVGASIFALFVWLVASAMMFTQGEAVNAFVFDRGEGLNVWALSFLLPALLPALGVLLVIVAMTRSKPPQPEVSAPLGDTTDRPGQPNWLNSPTPSSQSKPAETIVPARKSAEPPAPEENTPAPESSQPAPEASQPAPEASTPGNVPEPGDPSWRPPS